MTLCFAAESIFHGKPRYLPSLLALARPTRFFPSQALTRVGPGCLRYDSFVLLVSQEAVALQQSPLPGSKACSSRIWSFSVKVAVLITGETGERTAVVLSWAHSLTSVGCIPVSSWFLAIRSFQTATIVGPGLAGLDGDKLLSASSVARMGQ